MANLRRQQSHHKARTAARRMTFEWLETRRLLTAAAGVAPATTAVVPGAEPFSYVDADNDGIYNPLP